MSVENQNEIKSLVYILDKFGIGDQTYQQLHHMFGEMPSRTIVVDCRNGLKTEFIRTPNGARLSVEKELKELIRAAICKGTYTPESGQPFNVKYGGDGTVVSKITNFVSFFIAQVGTQSSYDLKMVAVTKASEKYDDLESDLAPQFEEINKLIETSSIDLDGVSVQLRWFLSGDMKMLKTLLGLKAANAMQGCPWCIETKENYHIIPPSIAHHNIPPLVRDMGQMVEGPIANGMKGRPLIQIEMSHVALDILHAKLRILDVLERNLVDDVLDLDQVAAVKKEPQVHLARLTSAIRSCGVPFRVWKSSDAKVSRDHEWTSLTGLQQDKVLANLPSKLKGLLHQDTEEKVILLWRKFFIIHSEVNADSCSHEDADRIFEMMKEWVGLFLSITTRKGYQKRNITPYIHAMMAHMPYFIHLHGALKMFSGQGLEKSMDDVKKIFRTKTSKLDSTGETLNVRKRIEHVHDTVPNTSDPRKYEKKADEYWQTGKSTSINLRKQKIEQEIKALQPSVNIGMMSKEDIKKRLSDLGIRTRIRDVAKLRGLLKSHLEQSRFN